MFNGYNDTPLISYNEFNQERLEKKQENVAKWSYGHEAGLQPAAQTHPSNRHSEFWPGKANFLGVGNVVKCNCTGCYPSSENQSYQGDTTRHRPWLPRTFPVPLNGSNESCKLPAYQWDNGLTGCQGPGYPDNNLAYVQENGGKYPYYRNYQNQPGVITSVKDAEFGKKGKNEGQVSPVQNGARQPPFCNPGYKRNYCEPNEKHSNVASYSVRLPVVEPFIKAVPSNLSQNRVPSTGYRSVKENMPQSYVDTGYPDLRKTIMETAMNGDKTGQLPTGVHVDYSHLNRDLQEAEPQKLFFDNTRHPDYYSRNNIQDVIKRNNQTVDNRKDCAMNQISMSEHYNLSRTKYQDVGTKLQYENYSKEFDKQRQDNSGCFQRNDDTKNENVNVHARLPRSALLFNDPRFADRTQSSFPYQSNPNAYRNYLRPEYPYQGYNPQERYDYPTGFQRNEMSEFRVPPQQTQSCEQFTPSQQFTSYLYEPHSQQNPDKTQQFYTPPVQTDSLDNKKPNYLEAIRTEEVNKNGANKISPLRLLRKKKFINVPQEPAPVSNVEAPPGLDVRKFWSTWAEEEEENVAPTQMVVLDCQNIDPEQAKLLHLYETDPVRLETDINSGKESGLDEINEPTDNGQGVQEVVKVDENYTTFATEPEVKSTVEAKALKKGKTGQENRGRKKTEMMDKWTEKKFDFLKRSEESKAAEILRHEEEKKKIMETRISLQQSLKKLQAVPENLFDENSQSDSIEEGNGSNLPTCEYRRNKFLDYTDVIVNGKEDDVKVVRSEKNPTDVLFPANVKLKEETGVEMEDILKKMSEINFENDAIVRKLKQTSKKQKKKKDQSENDDRTDKLTVETVTKPTIKFSIQKSHDLKISFKVLNSKEDVGGEDAQDKKTALEDSNSTELITLKYKSFQRDADRRATGELKKTRKGFRKKKMKTPVLKIKKSRYMQQEEKDPLANDEVEPNVEKKPFEEEFSNSDGFQVQETVDSAKIKLTFKRHKANLETEHKINSSKIEEEEPKVEEVEMINRKEGRTPETGTEIFPERIANGETPEENSRNSTITEENYDFETAAPIFTEFNPFQVETSETTFEETEKVDGQEETVINCEERNKSDETPKIEIQEISSELIKSTKSEEIETNHKSEESESQIGINCDLENSNGIKYESIVKSEVEDNEEKPEVDDNETGENFNETSIDIEESKIVLEDVEKSEIEMEETKPTVVDDVETTNIQSNSCEPVNCLPDDSGIGECSFSTIETDRLIDSSINQLDIELEDGEIIDSCDETENVKSERKFDFVVRKIERRHSTKPEPETWSRKKFSKAKSCPPDVNIGGVTTIAEVPVENIPLPVGPPPLESCLDLEKYKRVREAKEKPSIFQVTKEEFDLEKCRNPSPPEPQLGIFQRNSKIKFSFSRKSKFSKLSLNNESKFFNLPLDKNCKLSQPDPTPTDSQIEVPKDPVEVEKPNIELLCEDLGEGVEVIDAMTDLIREEFYECEDIPTSEDLTNGDDLEIEKVNDDKFRNIMQNCLENAKKFLNVGNLFSCSVDDLLELGCQGENEPEKPTNHISRDVLLTSCGDTNEDLVLGENIQPGDISVDFVPSFCSDVCPEILPVDNWPYLEEEVTSSPTKSSPELIPVLEANPRLENTVRKRVSSETGFASDGEGFRICSKISRDRRKTIESFTYEREEGDTSLKCRLSLEKIDFESAKLDYKSPSWQPKVMLFRISKNELRRMLRKTHRRSDSKTCEETPNELEPVLKKQKSEHESEKSFVKTEEVKSSDSVSWSDIEGRKRKKSRFRNLHTKRKTEPDTTTVQTDRQGVDPEMVLTEIFKNCDAKERSGSSGKEKSKKHDRRKDDERQKDKHEARKHRSKHGKAERGEEKKGKDWVCEVCGFDIADERVIHIKNHPFHCQSCHLAFRTEAHFTSHLMKKHKDIRNQHHCLLCELSFDTEEQYHSHLDTREHRHLESVEKNTINTLFTLLTGAPCPVLGLVEAKPEWLPNQAGTVHFYHQATPLSLALQYLKMHRDLSSFSTTSSTHPT